MMLLGRNSESGSRLSSNTTRPGMRWERTVLEAMPVASSLLGCDEEEVISSDGVQTATINGGQAGQRECAMHGGSPRYNY